MGWIKRNLIFVVGGALALALLGTAGFFIFKGWGSNSEKSDKLNEIYGTLKTLAGQKPAPGNDKIDNTKIAREQEQQIRSWITGAGACFQSVLAIPEGGVTSKTYATALGSTIYQLQQEAKADNVTLPPQYFFSFDAQNNKLTISAASLEPLAVQLGEVKAISEILFAARVNALVGIQRVRVSDDDAAGPQSDYIDQQPLTNDLAVLTPYVVTFRCFTPELGRVVSGFASSPNAFIVKSLNVQPANATAAPGEAMPGMPPGYPARYGEMPLPPAAAPAQPAPGKGGLQTVLKEQLLQVTLEVSLVKPLPKS